MKAIINPPLLWVVGRGGGERVGGGWGCQGGGGVGGARYVPLGGVSKYSNTKACV